MVRVDNIKGDGRKKILALGNTGDGKSTLCNVLSGFRPNEDKIFPVSAGAHSCTQETKFAQVFFNGNKENPISLIDTIGWSDSGNINDAKIIEELITKMKHACDHINLFLLVVNGQNPRITSTNIEMFKTFMGMFTQSFMSQVVVIFTRWSMDEKTMKREEKNTGMNYEQRARKYLNELKNALHLPSVPEFLIIDACYDQFDDKEKYFFEGSMNRLYGRLQSAQSLPTINVEKVKTENEKLKRDLEKHAQETRRLRQEIERRAREAEEASKRDAERRKREQETLQAMRKQANWYAKEHERRLADARGPNADAYADSRGVRAEASVGEAYLGDPMLLGARGPSASAGVSDRGIEVGAHAGEVTAGGFSARAGVKFGASDGQVHLGPVSAPCTIQ